MACWQPLILPTAGDKDMSSGFVVGAGRSSIWSDWFYAGNNVPSSPQPDGLITRANGIARAAEAKAEEEYASSAVDRIHLGQHGNAQPHAPRSPNIPWVEIRGRLLQEEA